MQPTESPTTSAIPNSVGIAVQVLWAVNAASAMLIFSNWDDTDGSTDNFIFSALILLFYAFVTLKVGAGKHWARLTWAGFVALELALLAAYGMEKAGDFEVLITYITTPFEIWAVYKLFSPESEQWFRPVVKR